MPDESGSLDFYLTEVSPRDKPWDKHRAEAQQVEQLYRAADYQRYADRIKQCSRWLGFKFTATDEGATKLSLNQAQFCRVRHCPVCQWRRTLMWYARFFQVLPKVTEAYPKARWIFLTLTVRNCPLEELRATVKAMNAGWKRLSERKEFPGIGWVKSLEVTRGEDDTAHPHFHAILMVRSSYFTHGYVKHARWVELWQKCMRLDYAPSVRVKRVDYAEKHFELTDSVDEPMTNISMPEAFISNGGINGIIMAVLETLKYSVKPEDLLRSADPDWLAGLTRQLHKTRAVAVGGILKEYLSEEEPTNEEMIQGTEEYKPGVTDEMMAWFGWREMAQRYKKVDRETIKEREEIIARNNEIEAKGTRVYTEINWDISNE